MGESKMREREYNYDWLRVCSMIAVIMIHVSTTWVGGFSAAVRNGGEVASLLHPLVACVYNSISRFAIPCFLMLSGAFIIGNSKNSDWKYFYKKSFNKLGIPTIVFSILYILYRMAFSFTGEQQVIRSIIAIAKDTVKGRPFYHLWYLYMLAEIYLMAPFVIKFKDDITYAKFRKVAIAFLMVAGISAWSSVARLSWDIGNSFEYLSYFMMGYVLREDARKSNLKGSALIAAGLLIEVATSFVEYHFQVVSGIDEFGLKFQILSPFAPPIVAASVLIFMGFARLNVRYNKWMEQLAALSFTIYLIHAGVWVFLQKMIAIAKGDNYLVMNTDNAWMIPASVLVVLLLSLILSNIYEKIYGAFKDRLELKLSARC